MHSFPAEQVDDEFYVTGMALPVSDPDRVRAVTEAYHMPVQEGWTPFELSVERALAAAYRHWGRLASDVLVLEGGNGGPGRVTFGRPGSRA